MMFLLVWFSKQKMIKRGRKSQIWIETVIYTLIGLAIIGILLSIVKPAIDRKKDEILIETSLEMMSMIEGQIEDIKYRGVGNSRIINLKIKKGKLEINSLNDFLEFTMESKYKYSQLGEEINHGKIKILTEEKTKKVYLVTLTLNYENNLNLTYNGQDKNKIFQPAPTPYTLTATNMGKRGNFVQIDFS